ncbi:MAG TPA: nucleotide exchange factor GrpE [Candidatus Babeliales bacterium]|jgi:molecular chaperone GrpE|nr:nucleotide exchange factor GrpE [Candidatus Babeliales bacterium]
MNNFDEINSNTELNNEQDVDTDCCSECLQEEADNNVPAHELEKCQQEVASWKEKYVRVNADLENVRRRGYKEQEQSVWKAQADIFTALLTVMDNFDRAQNELKKLEEHTEYQSIVNGILLIRKELTTLFDRFGVKEIPASKDFDPSLHEALASVDSPEHNSGDIVNILQKGYTFKGQILRPAKVSVAR